MSRQNHYTRRVKSVYAYLQAIKRLVFQKSHLSPYLPFLKETLPNKILRLYEDQSYQKDTGSDESKLNSMGKEKTTNKSNVLRILFSGKQTCDPISGWLMLWYIFVFIAILYSYVEAGIILVYGDIAWADIHSNLATNAATLYCIAVFTFDILLQFNTGFISRGVIVTERERVVSRYLHSYFIPDLLLVAVLIGALLSSDFSINFVKIVTVTKFMTMFQIDQLFLRKMAASQIKKVAYVIFKQFVTMFLLAHTIGIIFYAVDFALTNDPICINNNQLCWLYSATTYSPILSYGWSIQYFYSVYWGVNTITAINYGDISPNNPYETVYAILCFCFGSMVFGYVVNNVIRVILWWRRAHDNYKHQIILYTTYMDNLKIAKTAQYEITDLFESHFFQQKERNFSLQEQMKSRLPQSLKDNLIKDAYFKVYLNLEYILVKSPSIVKLLYSIQEKKFSENEIILSQGSILSKLSYLLKGEVELKCTFAQKIYQIAKIYNQHTFLSHYQFFVNERATYSLTATKTTTLYFVNKEDFEEQLSKYTDLKQNCRLLQYELRHEFNYEKIFYRCFFCRNTHHWYQCNDLFPLFKNVNLAKYPHQIQQFRYVKSSHKTLRDKGKLKVFHKFNESPVFIVLRKMQERIYHLRKLKKDMERSFDVDVGFDWQYYLPNFNLSVFKLKWKKQSKKQAIPSKGQLQRLFTLVQPFQ